jgi:ribosomal protein S18 acetylase RimI-like enzyme
MEIREFQPADTEQVERCIAELQDYERRIDERCLPGHAMRGWYLTYLQAECAAKQGRILIADVDGEIAGFVAVQARVPSEHKDEEAYEYAYVSDLGVLEVYRNKGIGRALIAGAEDFAVREGARWLRISVLAQNEIPRRLYERCGFGELVIEFEKELPSG